MSGESWAQWGGHWYYLIKRMICLSDCLLNTCVCNSGFLLLPVGQGGRLLFARVGVLRRLLTVIDLEDINDCCYDTVAQCLAIGGRK